MRTQTGVEEVYLTKRAGFVKLASGARGLELSDCFGVLLIASDCFGLLLVASDCFWLLRTASGCFGLLQVASNCFWLLRMLPAASDCFWLLRIASGCFGLLLAASDCSLSDGPAWLRLSPLQCSSVRRSCRATPSAPSISTRSRRRRCDLSRPLLTAHSLPWPPHNLPRQHATNSKGLLWKLSKQYGVAMPLYRGALGFVPKRQVTTSTDLPMLPPSSDLP